MDTEAEEPEDVTVAKDDRALAGGGEPSSQTVENVLEALLLASEDSLSLERIQRLFEEAYRVDRRTLRQALRRLDGRYAGTACELKEVAGGWRLQVRSEYAPWVGRLQQERPPRVSRAMLEILAIIAYRQPVTRGEIEQIRGVAVSTNLLRSLLERGWVQELGHKETPGRPVLYGSTQLLLDDLNLQSLSQLPELPEIKDMGQLEGALNRMIRAGSSVCGDEDGASAADAPHDSDLVSGGRCVS